MYRVLSVSPSEHHRWRKRPEKSHAIENKRLDAQIKVIYKKHKRRYASPGRSNSKIRSLPLTVSTFYGKPVLHGRQFLILFT